ncbi:MAG: hypothetical protein J0L88_03715 [Xanthomonadales bacterium]|nr:hypothetical protein [Xanthomonadales bacterium]
MRLPVSRSLARLVLVGAAMAMLAACGGRNARQDVVRGANIPATFDVTILAEKDGQFDYNEVPFVAQDLRSALNYRKEQGLPMETVLLKRSEKQSVKDGHVVAIARLSVDLKFKAYVEEDGEINEIQTTTKKND